MSHSMSVVDTVVTNFYHGVVTPIPTRVEYESSVAVCDMFSQMHSVMYMSDDLIDRFIPECVEKRSDGGWSFLFLNNLFGFAIHTINVSDVERCYFDRSGIPDSLSNFLRGIVLIDDFKRFGKYKSDGDSYPMFKESFREHIPQIKSIN